jgi:hypothetical protein
MRRRTKVFVCIEVDREASISFFQRCADLAEGAPDVSESADDVFGAAAAVQQHRRLGGRQRAEAREEHCRRTGVGVQQAAK